MYKIYILIFFLSISSKTFAQLDYELYESYADSTVKISNSKIQNITQLELQKDGRWLRSSIQQFNAAGLPISFIQYDENGESQESKDFTYDDKGLISRIETYKRKSHFGSTEFEFNDLGEMIDFKDYVYSSSDGKKILVRKTFIQYYPNKIIKQKMTIDGGDTTDIDFFSPEGILTKSLYNHSGMRTKKILYVWNKDKTILKENEYEDDQKIYSVITHKFKDGKEVHKSDDGASFYWKYDKDGRLIETNEDLYDIVYNTYDDSGRLVNKDVKIIFSDSNEKDLPKTIKFKYEYQLRK